MSQHLLFSLRDANPDDGGKTNEINGFGSLRGPANRRGGKFWHSKLCQPAAELARLAQKIPRLDRRLGGGGGPELQEVAGLAAERLADGLQRGKADGLGLAGFEDGEILRRDVHGGGEVVQPQLALGEDHVEIDDDGHG